MKIIEGYNYAFLKLLYFFFLKQSNTLTMFNVQNESNYYALKCNSELDKMYIQVASIWAKPSIAPLKLNEMKAIFKNKK